MIKGCCKDCVPPKRHPGCHGTCDEYLNEKAERERLKDKAREERHKDNVVISVEVHRSRRARNYKKK